MDVVLSTDHVVLLANGFPRLSVYVRPPSFGNKWHCSIYICMSNTKHWRLSLFKYETFIHLTFSLLTRGEGERYTIFTMQTVPTSPTVNSPAGLPQPRVKSQLVSFSKSPKISAHHFHAWRHSHPSPISYLGFLLWHLWSFVRKRELYSMCAAPAIAQSWIVQSPTKRNDKI